MVDAWFMCVMAAFKKALGRGVLLICSKGEQRRDRPLSDSGQSCLWWMQCCLAMILEKKKHLVFFKSYRSIVVSLMNTSINTVTSYWPVVYMMCSYSGSQFKK